jgi:acyl carrier protein
MNLNDFIQGVADQFEDLDREKLMEAKSLKEIDGWDSLTTMLVIGFIKTDFDKDITATEIRSCNTVKDLFDLVVAK